MKSDNMDKELDSAFRKSVEQMEIDPSEEFWEKANAEITAKENLSNKAKAFKWRSISFVLVFVVAALLSYAVYLQGKMPEDRMPFAGNVNRDNSAVQISNKEKGTLSQGGVGSSDSRPLHMSATTPEKKEGKNSSSESPAIIKTLRIKNSFEDQTTISYNAMGRKQTVNEEKGDNFFSFEKQNIPESKLILAINQSSDKTDLAPVNASGYYENLSLGTGHSKSARFSISVFFSPSLIKKFLKDNNENDNVNLKEVDNSDYVDYSFSTGIKLGIDWKRNWTFSSGLSYFRNTFRIKPTTVYAAQNTSGSISYTLPTSTGTIELPSGTPPMAGDSLVVSENSLQTISYIGIPLLVNYNFPGNRLSFYVSAGLSADILLDEKADINYEDDQNAEQTGEHIHGLNKITLGFYTGAGIKYTLSKFFLSAEPSFSGMITSMNKNTPIKTNPCFFGFGLGIGYHF